ncbi:MAG: hypothetical protein FRX48_09857 [Lasallia pustulata]|uniref:GntR C-terminal domain-containing protein n=1 Tax=Lasallia pustulata TaxID=136370 RepID=A0A5M8PAU6_9LECA|nr:MAG: hypothetical protein FRX48_09857 [Lasallia pustulata]
MARFASPNSSLTQDAYERLRADLLAWTGRGRAAARLSRCPISAAELRDLTVVRTEIEGLCLERAIAVGDVGWEAELVAAFHRLSRTPEREPADPQRMNEAWSTAHAAFHEAVVSAGNSPWLLRLRRNLYAQSERYRRLSVPLAQITRDLNGEHQGIMEAALAHDAGRVRVLMTQHLELTTCVLLEQSWLADAPPGPARRGMPPAAKNAPRGSYA